MERAKSAGLKQHASAELEEKDGHLGFLSFMHAARGVRYVFSLSCEGAGSFRCCHRFEDVTSCLLSSLQVCRFDVDDSFTTVLRASMAL